MRPSLGGCWASGLESSICMNLMIKLMTCAHSKQNFRIVYLQQLTINADYDYDYMFAALTQKCGYGDIVSNSQVILLLF